MKTATRPVTHSAMRKAVLRPTLAPAARGRACSVRVMAFRDSRTQEHQKRLQSTAQQFMAHWIDGCREGPTDQVMAKLSKLVDDDVVMQAAHPLGNDKGKGLDDLRNMLRESNITKLARCAVSDDSDVAFCLVECEDATVDEFATSRGVDYSKTVRKSYGIVKLNLAFDDADNSYMTLKVTGISERNQMEPAEACMLAVLEPSHRLPSYASREEEGFQALKLAGAWHFPAQHIAENGSSPLPFMNRSFDVKAAEASIQKWCTARSSDFNEAQLLPEAVDVNTFRLWDGYGVLPTACNYNLSARDQIAKNKPVERLSCLLPTGPVLDLIKSYKAENKMRCTLIDHAICEHSNVGFAHWRTHVRPKDDPESRFILEAMAMLVFNDKGKIIDTWMLRDPTPAEKELMRSTASASPDPSAQPAVYGSFRRVPDAPEGPTRIIPASRIQRV